MKRYLIGALIGAAITLMSAPHAETTSAPDCSATETAMSRLGFAATPAAHGVECGIEVERRARGAVTNLSTGSHLLTQPSRM